MSKILYNQAFIDGQNLHLGTMRSTPAWKVDLYKFRTYLREKYHIEKAYYFLGCNDPNQQELYQRLQEAGFILVFREHDEDMASIKKGNVDTDVVFYIMRKIAEHERINEFYLVSSDGDYFRVVKYLYEKGKLGGIIHPQRQNASSLYRKLPCIRRDCLDLPEVKRKIMYMKHKK